LFPGLLTLVGLIIYIGAITEESGNKPKSMDEPKFKYHYGPSLILTIASFVIAELTGVLSVHLYISHRTLAYFKERQRNHSSVPDEGGDGDSATIPRRVNPHHHSGAGGSGGGGVQDRTEEDGSRMDLSGYNSDTMCTDGMASKDVSTYSMLIRSTGCAGAGRDHVMHDHVGRDHVKHDHVGHDHIMHDHVGRDQVVRNNQTTLSMTHTAGPIERTTSLYYHGGGVGGCVGGGGGGGGPLAVGSGPTPTHGARDLGRSDLHLGTSSSTAALNGFNSRASPAAGGRDSRTTYSVPRMGLLDSRPTLARQWSERSGEDAALVGQWSSDGPVLTPEWSTERPVLARQYSDRSTEAARSIISRDWSRCSTEELDAYKRITPV